MKNTLAWLRRNSDSTEWTDPNSFYGKYMGHQVRFTCDGAIEIGNKDFDRWANSVAYEFVVDETKSISRQMNLAVSEARKDTSPYWHRSMALIKIIMDQ
jgi:hypothetical protein